MARATSRMIHTPPAHAPEPGPEYLASTRFLDCASESIRRFARATTSGEASEVGKAVKLFYAVRDGWRYDPFAMRLDPEQYVASNVLAADRGYCIPKAILLAATARAVGIPAAIGLADVVNHLTTEKLKARMGGKTYFMHHGYAVLHLDGQWVKAAPAFNIELCRRFGVHPTEFDGRSHALFQEYDTRDRRHMEYVKDHGCWSDFPYEKVAADFRAFYPPSTYGEDETGERFEDGAPVR
jgi:transglutaminase-like putative cysteine protease